MDRFSSLNQQNELYELGKPDLGINENKLYVTE